MRMTREQIELLAVQTATGYGKWPISCRNARGQEYDVDFDGYGTPIEVQVWVSRGYPPNVTRYPRKLWVAESGDRMGAAASCAVRSAIRKVVTNYE